MPTTYTTFQTNPEDSDLCTLSTCSLQYAFLTYRPTLIGNGIYLAIFAVLLLVHGFLGIRYKTWGFLIGTTCMCLLEIIGYAGRLTMYSNPFPLSNFLMYFVPLAIAPTFLVGALYLVLGRYIVATARRASRLAPRTYTGAFIALDVTSLVLQAGGGALTATADDPAGETRGTNILIGGLALQVASMAVFLGLWAEFAYRLRRHVPEEQRDARFADIRMGWKWTGFPPAIFLAVVFVFIRSIYRCIELHGGFNGSLANDEVAFMVLESPMIIIAAALLTVWHPGVVFQGRWADAMWRFDGKDDVEAIAVKVED